MPKRWLIREHDAAQIVRLEREAGVSAVVGAAARRPGHYRSADRAEFS